MKIGFRGQLEDEPQIVAGFIGCGSHSFRNLYPCLQFAPVDLVATCDLDMDRARAFANQFGARQAYSDYREMLEREELDAVFLCVGYDRNGRPLYPQIAIDCMKAGCHVWMEKPPAAACAEIESMQEAARESGRNAMVGLKKMFFPANEKAKELMEGGEFGAVQLAMLQYPQHVPTVEAFEAYSRGEKAGSVVGFLDHLCHPASLLVYLLGMPASLHYERSAAGAGLATFGFASGAIASIALTRGASSNGGMEHTTIVGNTGCHITVQNNLRVTLHRNASLAYGQTPSFYAGTPAEAAAVWEPEFSLGQLYNKGLFLLGYYGEIAEFARSILEGRPPVRATLEHAWQVTRIFAGFAEGPGKKVDLTVPCADEERLLADVRTKRTASKRIRIDFSPTGDDTMSKAIVLRADQCESVRADWGELTWFASGKLGNSDEMTIGRCVIRPGQANPPHSHPNCSEVLVVMQGRIAHLIEEGREVEMGVGDTITVPPDLPHQARNIGDGDAVLSIAFSSADRQTKGE